MLDDADLLQEFVTVSREHLEAIEPDLLVLETAGENVDPEIINRLFRAIHNIKGTSGFFNLPSLTHLSHVMENVLMKIRDGEMVPNTQVVEPLLQGVDILLAMLEDIHAVESVDHQALLACLEKVLSGESIATKPSASQNTTAADTAIPVFSPFKPDLEGVRTAVAHGKKLYAITFSQETDLTAQQRTINSVTDHLASMGLVLDTAYPAGYQPGETPPDHIRLLYATVLEPALLLPTLKLKPEQMVPMAPADILSPVAVIAEPSGKTPSGTESHAKSTEKPDAPIPVKSFATPTESTIRVRVSVLDALMNLAGEMVLSRNQLVSSMARESIKSPSMVASVQAIKQLMTELQEQVIQTRMQPIGNILGKFPRLVRDLSHHLEKQIELRITGEEVELDKSILENLGDPLTHLIRNACDHAIESPEDRMKAGKPPTGLIQLSAFCEGGQINITLTDDGKGLKPEIIAAKAVEKGLITVSVADKLSSQEAIDLIFLPGFSTAVAVTDISGRGVGMDVVKKNIEQMGGRIYVESSVGEGTTFLLQLPLTMAIIPSLLVGASCQRFALPQLNIQELVRIKAAQVQHRVEVVNSLPVLRLRERLIPLLHLAEILGLDRVFLDPSTESILPDRRVAIADRRSPSTDKPDLDTENWQEKRLNPDRRYFWQSDMIVVLIRVGVRQYGLIVDELFDLQEIVVKPLTGYMKDCELFAGATILGDGRVALILDPEGIALSSGLTLKDQELEQHQRKLEQAEEDTIEKESLIVFNNGENELFAVPMAQLARIEPFHCEDISRVGNQEFLTFNGRGIRILRLEQYLPVGPAPDMEHAYLLIPKGKSPQAGIYASRIQDSIMTPARMESSPFANSTFCRSMVVDERLLLMIKPHSLMGTAGITGEEL